MHRNLTRFMYLTVGTLWQLTAAPKIDAFELKKYLATIVADKIGYKEKSEFEHSSRDIQGKQNYCFPRSSRSLIEQMEKLAEDHLTTLV